jgi:hypothetical protein
MAKSKQENLGLAGPKRAAGPVECLGQTFETDEARRAHFTELLRQKLRDPAFRATPGFPKGTDEDILRMSDPPYYTACPNPFLGEFVRLNGKAHAGGDEYRREPFTVDTSVGKSDAIYKAHSYHTKVPHLAIVPSILHYTEPGDLVLDGFCGSGMTGVAAQLCGSASAEYRAELEAAWKKEGRGKPKWGARRTVLNDLAPAATFISANYNLAFDATFGELAEQVLEDVESRLGWMYETAHGNAATKGRINYMVWSEVFTCPECASDLVFTDAALDSEENTVDKVFRCARCDAELTKDRVERKLESYIDRVTGEPAKRIKLVPVLINYRVGRREFEKKPDESDLQTLIRISKEPLPAAITPVRFPIEDMYHGSRLQPKGFEWVHQLYTERALIVLGALAAAARATTPHSGTARALLALVYHQTVNASLRNSYRPGASFGNRAITGVYYVSSMPAEANAFSLAKGTLRRLRQLERTAWKQFAPSNVVISTGDAARLMGLPNHSVDYVFTDPPFGSNIFYADLNLAYEQWLGVREDAKPEAIVDSFKSKGLNEYQSLMRSSFEEYARVLKPGRWMTVVFSNSSNAVWRAIQEALGTAGFVVADVRTLDKQMGSYRQVTSSAVKQDLVISAYKPTEALARRFQLGSATADDAWAFVREHLRNVPVLAEREGDLEVVAERTAQTLHDRMIAFFVQRGVAVPLSGPEFFDGLESRFVRRDAMYFLTDQVTVYDKKRAAGGNVRQLSLFPQDEASAIRWLRQQLDHKPQSFQDLQPQFMKVAPSWARHEKTVELKALLHENFLHYDGQGEVPAPIHAYLSSNHSKLRNLAKDDPELRATGRDRWYVPSVHRQGDLEQLRLRALLREFDEYRTSGPRKLKQFRTEAVRAGFKAAYDARDYRTIVDVAAKLPDAVVQEDEKLLMYLDVAQMRIEDAEPSGRQGG